MNEIDTPTDEMKEAQPQRSVNTTVPVADAQKDVPSPHKGVQKPEDADALPQLPHERDQSVGMTDGNPSATVQQAFKDVQRGLVDTDASKRAHNVGKPVIPPEPPPPGTPGPVEPDHT